MAEARLMQDEISRRIKRLEKKPVPEIILNQIKDIIIDLDLKVGDKLPSERELAEMLNASRPSLRSALQILEVLGIIEIIHGSGAYLRQQDFSFVELPISLLLSKDAHLIEELVEMRTFIERQIVELAIQRASDEDLRIIKEYLEDCERPERQAELQGQFNLEFEQLLASMTKNRPMVTLQKAVHQIWQQILATNGQLRPKKQFKTILSEHREIYEAIRARDRVRAVEACNAHYVIK